MPPVFLLTLHSYTQSLLSYLAGKSVSAAPSPLHGRAAPSATASGQGSVSAGITPPAPSSSLAPSPKPLALSQALVSTAGIGPHGAGREGDMSLRGAAWRCHVQEKVWGNEAAAALTAGTGMGAGTGAGAGTGPVQVPEASRAGGGGLRLAVGGSGGGSVGNDRGDGQREGIWKVKEGLRGAGEHEGGRERDSKPASGGLKILVAAKGNASTAADASAGAGRSKGESNGQEDSQ